MIKDGNVELVVALKKGTPGIDQSLIVGELVDSTEHELIIKKAVSPSLVTETSTLMFQQHLIPTVLMNAEFAASILTCLRKDSLALYAIMNSNDPHPLCSQYREFWADPTEDDDSEAVQPDPEELVQQ